MAGCRVRIVRGADLVPEPWRNGRGTTREIARSDTSDPWVWRIAVARSEEPAAFSAFPGTDRTLVVVRGETLRLDFGDGEVRDVARGEPTTFSGSREVTGSPTAGGTEQLNVMWRPALVRARVERLDRAVESLGVGRRTQVAVHVLDGTVTLDDQSVLAAGDTALVRSDGSGQRWVVDVRGTAFAVSLEEVG